MSKRKRSIIEILISQWPGLLGLTLIGSGLLIVYDAYAYKPHEFSGRLVALLIACGFASTAYWSLANNNSDYHF